MCADAAFAAFLDEALGLDEATSPAATGETPAAGPVTGSIVDQIAEASNKLLVMEGPGNPMEPCLWDAWGTAKKAFDVFGKHTAPLHAAVYAAFQLLSAELYIALWTRIPDMFTRMRQEKTTPEQLAPALQNEKTSSWAADCLANGLLTYQGIYEGELLRSRQMQILLPACMGAQSVFWLSL